jgi:hypothetical protein
MACVRTVTMREFRGMDLMSGSLRVYGRSRARGGARPPKGTAIEREQLKPAATDDGSGALVSGDATTSVAAATTRTENAEAAEQKPEAGRATKKKDREEPPSLWDQKAELGGGELLPEDGAEFVAAVQKKIDLVQLAVFVLRRGDERLTQRQLEQLLEMKYGKNARGGEKSMATVIDIPGMTRD